jgi:protein involved in polysaccharide export with SLBB domain
MPPRRLAGRLAAIPLAMLGLLLPASIGVVLPSHAQLAPIVEKSRRQCPPFRGEGGFAAVRNIVQRLRVGDVIEYYSFGEVMDSISFLDTGASNSKTDGFNRIKVGANGYIFMPRVGTVHVVGLTIPEAEVKMRNALKKFYRTPTLSIFQIDQTILRVTISGHVKSPGTYQLSTPLGELSKEEGALRQRPNTVEEVVVRAGGLLNTADFDHVEVHTREGTCFTVNLDIDQSGRSRDGSLALDDGDSLIVRGVEKIDHNSERFKLMARSDLASARQRVFVLGNVLKPGVIEIHWLTTPMEVVAIAGGPTSIANKEAFIAQPVGETKAYTYRKFPINVRSKEFSEGFEGVLTQGSILYVGKSTLANFQQMVQGFLGPAATAVGVSEVLR